jgi:hypothetical protein
LSIDLDLFTNESFSEADVFDELVTCFPGVVKTDEGRNSLSLMIEEVKVDLLAHRYPLLANFTIETGVRLWSTDDVIAMKLGAISGRGAKKDFWDVAELLNHFTLEQMLRLFKVKYTNSDPGYIVRSLTYFDDTEEQIDPIVLNNITWTEVKRRIAQAVKGLV